VGFPRTSRTKRLCLVTLLFQLLLAERAVAKQPWVLANEEYSNWAPVVTSVVIRATKQNFHDCYISPTKREDPNWQCADCFCSSSSRLCFISFKQKKCHYNSSLRLYTATQKLSKRSVFLHQLLFIS
jgi:hypothetical protein